MVAPSGAAVAVKLNSDGQNSILHYLCYVELTSSAQEPSPRYTVTFGQMGKASLRIKILRQHNKGKAKSNFAVILTVGAKLHFDHRNASFAATAPRSGGSARRRRGRAVVLTTDRAETVYTPHGTATEKVPCGA